MHITGISKTSCQYPPENNIVFTLAWNFFIVTEFYIRHSMTYQTDHSPGILRTKVAQNDSHVYVWIGHFIQCVLQPSRPRPQLFKCNKFSDISNGNIVALTLSPVFKYPDKAICFLYTFKTIINIDTGL